MRWPTSLQVRCGAPACARLESSLLSVECRRGAHRADLVSAGPQLSGAHMRLVGVGGSVAARTVPGTYHLANMEVTVLNQVHTHGPSWCEDKRMKFTMVIECPEGETCSNGDGSRVAAQCTGCASGTSGKCKDSNNNCWEPLADGSCSQAVQQCSSSSHHPPPTILHPLAHHRGRCNRDHRSYVHRMCHGRWELQD